MQDKKEAAGKLPPQNLDAEQSLLGAVLISGAAIDEVMNIVNPADFYDFRHKKVFEVMKELRNRGEAIDVLTVSESLRTRDWLDSVGGASYVSSLADVVPTAAHIKDYAKIVRDKSILRRLIETSTAIIEKSFNEEEDPSDILKKAEDSIFRITESQQKLEMQEVKDLVGDVWENIKTLGNNPEALTGLPIGFSKMDEYTSGLQKDELIIVAARPSLGKTSLAMNIAYNLAVNKKKNILIFSFEMSEQDLLKRLLSYGSKVKLQKLRSGKFLTREDSNNIINVAGKLSEARIWIDTSDNDVFGMRAKGRTLSNKLKTEGKKLDLVIIDYMQLVRPSDSKVSREQQISIISRALKAMARELTVPVMAISQLNREVEKRDRTGGNRAEGGKIPPRLSDLRESGAIEQDADVVIFIDRESPDGKNAEKEEGDLGDGVSRQIKRCKLIIAKNRNGPTGDQKVIFVPELTAFVETSARDTDEAVDYGPQEF